MAPYDAEFEAQIEDARKKGRLLVVQSIHFKASKVQVQGAIRAMLTRSSTAEFFWRAPNRPENTHTGSVMLAFTTRVDLIRGEKELEGLKIRGRPIKLVKASREAVSVLFRPSPTSLLISIAVGSSTEFS